MRSIALLALCPALALGQATVSVDTAADVHPISPLIYGINFASDSEVVAAKLALTRWVTLPARSIGMLVVPAPSVSSDAGVDGGPSPAPDAGGGGPDGGGDPASGSGATGNVEGSCSTAGGAPLAFLALGVTALAFTRRRS